MVDVGVPGIGLSTVEPTGGGRELPSRLKEGEGVRVEIFGLSFSGGGGFFLGTSGDEGGG